MGRQRKDPRLPPGLRERDGYYSYRNPADGKEWGIGRDRRDAIAQAYEANAALRKAPSLLDRINGNGVTWDSWCETFESIINGRDLTPGTRKTNRAYLKRMRNSFDSARAARDITTAEIAAVIDVIANEGKKRTAQAFRSFLCDSFDRMIAKGIRTDNPAKVTDEISVKVKRARLSLEVFLAIYDSTEVAWLRNAMALALVTGQDRDTCAHARFADFHDGFWWIRRKKTDANIRLPTHLRLEVFGLSLEDVVRQCRSTGIVSAHLVHQTQRAKGARLGMKMHVDAITRVFSAEIERLGLAWGDRTPPTFHEIRSLSTRLYEEQNSDSTPVNTITTGGKVSTKNLLGHTEESTTDIYRDGRGEWVTADIRKPLPR